MNSSHCHLVVGQLRDEGQGNGKAEKKPDTKMYRYITPMMVAQAL